MKAILCDKCKKELETDKEPIYFTVRFMNNRTLSDQIFEFCCECRDKVYQNMDKFIQEENDMTNEKNVIYDCPFCYQDPCICTNEYDDEYEDEDEDDVDDDDFNDLNDSITNHLEYENEYNYD